MKMLIMKDNKNKILVIIVFFILWEIISRAVNSDVIIPNIKLTLSQLIEIIQSKNFVKVITSSIFRTVVGFVIAFTLGIIAGILSFINSIFREVFKNISKLLASIPTVAIILLILIWLKANTVSILIGIFMVFPIIYESVYSSINDYDKNIISMLNLYKVPLSKKITKIYLPKILIDIVKVISSALSINFKMVIAGEVLSQPKYAIGSKLYFEKTYFNTAGVFSWILIILFLSFILEKLVLTIVKTINKSLMKENKVYKH